MCIKLDSSKHIAQILQHCSRHVNLYFFKYYIDWTPDPGLWILDPGCAIHDTEMLSNRIIETQSAEIINFVI